MMNNIYFENVNQIGNLYLDYVFFEFEFEPILFTCIDENKNIYLCLCSEIRGGQKWIITKTNTNLLTNLINEKIDIYSAFFVEDNLIIVTMDIQGNEKSTIIKTSDIDELDLPKKNVYIKCDKDKALNYIWSKAYNDIKKLLDNWQCNIKYDTTENYDFCIKGEFENTFIFTESNNFDYKFKNYINFFNTQSVKKDSYKTIVEQKYNNGVNNVCQINMINIKAA